VIKLRIMGTLPDGFTPDDNQRFWIAGDPLKTHAEFSGFDDESRSISRSSQKEAGTNFDFQVPIDTGNETFTEPFKTSRLFDTALEAWQWCNSFSRQDPTLWPHPVQGDCVERFENADGTFYEERLYNCLVSKPQIERIGKTVNLSYQITGGRIEPYATGSVVKLLASGLTGEGAQMHVFGNAVASVVSDASTISTAWSLAADYTLPVGARIIIKVKPEIAAADIDCHIFKGTLVTPVAGFTTLSQPLVLSEIATAFNLATVADVTVVTLDGRSALHVQISPDFYADYLDTRISLEIYVSGILRFEGYSDGNGLISSLLMDSAENILVADDLT